MTSNIRATGFDRFTKVGGLLKLATQTAHQARGCINSPCEIKVSGVTLLRLAAWCRQRLERSKNAGQIEQGGSSCQSLFPPAPNDGSRTVEGNGDVEGDGGRTAGSVVDADSTDSAAGNVGATDADAGSASRGPATGPSSKPARKIPRGDSRDSGNSRRKGG